ncbi:MAG: bifunctional diguanylate cyclase/phosphodiesterase, partial [Rhodanobacter sp.]
MTYRGTVGATSFDGPTQLNWSTQLCAARGVQEMAQTIATLMQEQAGCEQAFVLWRLDGPTSFRSVPALSIEAADRNWLVQASRSESPHRHHLDQQRVALRLCELPEPALLLLQLQPGFASDAYFERLHMLLQAAGQHLRRALEWSGMQRSLRQLERSERLQRALFAISDLAGSEHDMPTMLRDIHAIVSTLMYAENFFIVVHDTALDTFCFLYFVDVKDTDPPIVGEEMPMSTIRHTLTWHVMSDGNARMGNAEALRQQVQGPV